MDKLAQQVVDHLDPNGTGYVPLDGVIDFGLKVIAIVGRYAGPEAAEAVAREWQRQVAAELGAGDVSHN